jgi:mRNA interferase RelE/StbE
LAWKVEYTKTARDQLRKLDKPIATRILDTLEKRIAGQENPRQTGKPLNGPLGEFWCYRIGDYRLICDIQDKLISILVLQVGNRREVYR